MSYDPMKVWENSFPGKTHAQDHCGSRIEKVAHVRYQRNSKYAWDVDHIVPVAKGGTDAYSNLRPLHVDNNDAKGDNLDGHWKCAKTN